MRYVYPAVFYKDKKLPDTWSVVFPDLSGAVTYGYSFYDAMVMAEDVLAGVLVSWEDSKAGKSDPPFNNRVDEPTPLENVKAEPDEYSSAAFVVPVRTDTDIYRQVLADLPPRPEDDSSDDGLELPETYVRELCKVAGVKYPFEEES